MATKQNYVYHIITSTDISEFISNCQTYPIVHFYNETCKEKCGNTQEGCRSTTTTTDNATADPTDADSTTDGRGDIAPTGDELGKVPERRHPKLCPGPDGVIESQDASGYRIRFRNGRCRTYTECGGNSVGNKSNNNEVEPGICKVGTYTASSEGSLGKLYTGPYKLIAIHYGTRRPHWHLIYYSPNKQWGVNARLGRVIRGGTYKNKSVDCLSCLRQYLYSGNGRQVLQDILSEEHIETCQCAEHYCGMDSEDQWKNEAYEIDCAEGGDPIFRHESNAIQAEQQRMVDATLQTDGSTSRKPGYKFPSQKRNFLDEFQSGPNNNDARENQSINGRNTDIIILLCERGTFTESEAMAVFAKSHQGINLMCTKQYNEKIRNWVHIARVLVFQESLKQRFERAKKKFELENEALIHPGIIEETKLQLKEIITRNKIDLIDFFKNTYKHFNGASKKKNNLFFLGPPSTGKTMIMTSLVECHFNYCRLTGLISNSSFNFSGLLHTNACLMDECKLTDNQFEQWKLLASGLPMSTDVKYKDRCDVMNVILYTCSNYPIEMYCNVPLAQDAVKSRTIKYELKEKCPWYIKISPHVWESCWADYGFII